MLSIPLLCSLSFADRSELSDCWKRGKMKARFSGYPFRGTTHAHSSCVSRWKQDSSTSARQIGAQAWANRFVYILISSTRELGSPLRTPRIAFFYFLLLTCSFLFVSCCFFVVVVFFFSFFTCVCIIIKLRLRSLRRIRHASLCF